jgi:GrpB-like predicted nucleotidyltransferase (UPF0157 family)
LRHQASKLLSAIKPSIRGVVMTLLCAHSKPADVATDRAHPSPIGSWTIDPHPSDAGICSPSMPPIGRYRRVPVQVHQADPDAPEVARRLIALIATRWPATPAEHVGSTAVPGLAGKNIIDLLLAAEPAHIPAITKALLELGFQPQVPAAFPPTRPMLWGTFRHGTTEYPVHVHVVPAGSPEVTAMRGFRDALRADPALRRRYAVLKRAIVAGGPADPVAFTKAKHHWIAATLAHLGLVAHQPRRLYQDDLDPDSPTGGGLLDRQVFGIGRPSSTLRPQIWLELAVPARRVGSPHPHPEERNGHAQPARRV